MAAEEKNCADCRQNKFIYAHYKFLILLAGITAVIIIQIHSHIYQKERANLFISLLQEKETAHIAEDKSAEAQVSPDPTADLILEGIIGLQKTVREMQIASIRPAERRRDDEIIGMLAEKLTDDYTQRGLQLFREADYANAAASFAMALRHQEGNTALMFYHAYSLYLSHTRSALSEDDLTKLETNIAFLRGKSYSQKERLDFSAEEMEHRVIEMEYNLEEMRRRKGRNEIKTEEINASMEKSYLETEDEHQNIRLEQGALAE